MKEMKFFQRVSRFKRGIVTLFALCISSIFLLVSAIEFISICKDYNKLGEVLVEDYSLYFPPQKTGKLYKIRCKFYYRGISENIEFIAKNPIEPGELITLDDNIVISEYGYGVRYLDIPSIIFLAGLYAVYLYIAAMIAIDLILRD